MIDNLSIYGLESYDIDTQKSYIITDSSTNNIIINTYLNKDHVLCPNCKSNLFTIIKTKISSIKCTSSYIENYTIKLHRYKYCCKNCLAKFYEDNPFQHNHSVSQDKIFKIVLALKDRTLTYEKVAEKYQVSPTYVMNLFDSYVNIQRHKLSEVICIDEIHAKKLAKHIYCFVILSPFEKKVIDVLDSRRKNFLFNYFYSMPKQERLNVKYVSMDMWKPYKDIAKILLPNAIICIDSFHVVKNLTERFNTIRKKIMKKYSKFGKTDNPSYWLLKKYFWVLYLDQSKITDDIFYMRKLDREMSRRDILYEILKLDPILKKAYDLMVEYKEFNKIAVGDENDEIHYKNMITDFFQLGEQSYTYFARLLKRWKKEIFNSFVRVNGKRINNGYIERMNEEIGILIMRGHGLTNFKRTRNRILYSLNKDEPILINPRKYGVNKKEGHKRGKYKKANK